LNASNKEKLCDLYKIMGVGIGLELKQADRRFREGILRVSCRI